MLVGSFSAGGIDYTGIRLEHPISDFGEQNIFVDPLIRKSFYIHIKTNLRTFYFYVIFIGKAQIRDVEFYHSGQEGWTDSTDPRYSVTFLNLGVVRIITFLIPLFC